MSVCTGVCTADTLTGVINNAHGTAMILTSSAMHDGNMGVNVTLVTTIPGVCVCVRVQCVRYVCVRVQCVSKHMYMYLHTRTRVHIHV